MSVPVRLIMLNWLIETGPWPARRVCGQWEDAEVLWAAVANIATAGAFLGIPFALISFMISIWPQTTHSQRALATIFVCLFVTCALGHLLSGVMPFYWPAYRLIAAWDTVTAVVGLCAVAILRPILAIVAGRTKL